MVARGVVRGVARGVVAGEGASGEVAFSSASINSSGDQMTVAYTSALASPESVTLASNSLGITATYLSGAGTSSHVYDLNRIVSAEETVTVTGATFTSEPVTGGNTALVGNWDFSESAAPYVSKFTPTAHSLTVGAGTVTKVADSPYGDAVSFSGSDHLVIPSGSVGDLDLSLAGNNATVLAWVKPDNTTAGPGCIAGMWQEYDPDPRRQYALFIDLDLYGGENQVCGHVSFTGDPTPGYIYAREYSSSAQKVNNDRWILAAFTYDGSEIKSYLDATFDPRPTYTDPEVGDTYAKNPYEFPDGLNPNDKSAFRVGASGGNAGPGPIGNWIVGRIAGLKVFKSVLTQAQIFKERLYWIGTGEAIFFWDFFESTAYALGDYGRQIGQFGWSAVSDALGTNNTFDSSAYWVGSFVSPNHYINSAANANPSMAYKDGLPAVPTSIVDSVNWEMHVGNTGDTARLCVKVDGSWYVSTTIYSNAATGGGSNWTNAESKSGDLSALSWDNLTLTVGSELSVSAAGISLPSGDITGIGFYAPSITTQLRIRDVALIKA